MFSENHSPNTPVVLFGMLPHEQKMTVMHFVIKRPLDFTDPVRSKEELVFQVGYRRFSACPIFSQHATGDKHKVCFLTLFNTFCVDYAIMQGLGFWGVFWFAVWTTSFLESHIHIIFFNPAVFECT